MLSSAMFLAPLGFAGCHADDDGDGGGDVNDGTSVLGPK